jgi:hypothetical protein
MLLREMNEKKIRSIESKTESITGSTLINNIRQKWTKIAPSHLELPISSSTASQRSFTA